MFYLGTESISARVDHPCLSRCFTYSCASVLTSHDHLSWGGGVTLHTGCCHALAQGLRGIG